MNTRPSKTANVALTTSPAPLGRRVLFTIVSLLAAAAVFLCLDLIIARRDRARSTGG